MSFTEFLRIKIVESDNLTLTVYNIILSLLMILFGAIIIKVIKRLFRRLEKKGTLDEGSSVSIYTITKYILWVIILVLSLDTMGLQVSILIASAAALLVGVGLGLQQLFNDLASGIILLIERNLKVGDVIELENGIIGRVIGIGLRTSKVRTRDDVVMIVPNSQFVNKHIINWSHLDKLTRFKIDIGVAYGSDVELVRNILLEVAGEHPQISQIPLAFVRFLDFGESSLDFQLYFWVNQSFTVENVKSDLRFAVNREFSKNNIRIPFPQRDVHMIPANK
ncbi:MAG: mechanosensitive ion channel [Bacteroidales bacterium]|nr:mechanosensitive ion channel [Bacteroidales bacterium]